MKNMMILSVAIIFTMLSTAVYAGGSDGLKIYSVKGDFAGVRQDTEDAIVNRGYNIDFDAFIGKMLKRTSGDIGSKKALYKDARFMTFCSAALTRQAMEADPEAIGFCPYTIFVYELDTQPGTVHVGYRKPTMGSSDAAKPVLTKIQKLLDDIAREATK